MRQAVYHRTVWVFIGYVLLVILWGAFVRATGSGAGCGDHWPLCNGQVLPRDPAVQTLIELGHRITSGLAWIGAFGLWWLARRAFAKGHPARAAAFAVAFLMSTEALVGAGLVLFEMVAGNESHARALWMVAHLLNTFLLLFALAALAAFAGGLPPPRVRGRFAEALQLGAMIVLTLCISMLGAVAALGDTLFPARSLQEGLAQDFSATSHLFLRLRGLHPLLGLIAGALILYLAGRLAVSAPKRAVRRMALVVVALYTVQVGVGFLNLGLLAPVWMQLIHLLMADFVWLGLILLTLQALAQPEAASLPDGGGAAAPAQQLSPATSPGE